MKKPKKGGLNSAPKLPPRYVGPEYKHGIRLELGQRNQIEVRPKDFDDKTRKAFVATYPQYAGWWSESQ